VSIRLRLTLLYSLILALTLVWFSATLYAAQTRLTYDNVKTNLQRQGDAMANPPRRFPRPATQSPDAPSPALEKPPAMRALGTTLPGRWAQTLSLTGTVTAHTADLSGVTLPLSAPGMSAVTAGFGWFETARVEDQPVLIYSRPANLPDGTRQILQIATPIAERQQSLLFLRMILLIGCELAIVIASAAGWFVAGTALRPIDRITHTAYAIGVERDFSHRVQHAGPADEVGRLAVTFNAMLTELEMAYHQLEQALDSQRRFVADASHELRTPLTTVRGNIELLRVEPPLALQERAEVIADTTDEVERLIRLVNQLLVLARADAGQPLRREPLQLKTLLEDVCRQAKLLSSRGVLCRPPDEGLVVGDRDALKQVLLILVENALVHTSPETVVELGAACVDGRADITVRDSGHGISSDVLPHIFERFYRGQASRSGNSTGLGLAIAKELVEAQGGTIAVESGVGAGTKFTVTMPLANG